LPVSLLDRNAIWSSGRRNGHKRELTPDEIMMHWRRKRYFDSNKMPTANTTIANLEVSKKGKSRKKHLARKLKKRFL